MTTQEKNEVIAKWMGWERVLNSELWYHKNPPLFCTNIQGKFYYDTSWDWLMPVVEKIEGMGFKFTIHNDSAMIERTFNRDFKQGQHLSNLGESKKEATFNTAFEFIEWYNANVKEK